MRFRRYATRPLKGILKNKCAINPENGLAADVETDATEKLVFVQVDQDLVNSNDTFDSEASRALKSTTSEEQQQQQARDESDLNVSKEIGEKSTTENDRETSAEGENRDGQEGTISNHVETEAREAQSLNRTQDISVDTSTRASNVEPEQGSGFQIPDAYFVNEQFHAALEKVFESLGHEVRDKPSTVDNAEQKTDVTVSSQSSVMMTQLIQSASCASLQQTIMDSGSSLLTHADFLNDQLHAGFKQLLVQLGHKRGGTNDSAELDASRLLENGSTLSSGAPQQIDSQGTEDYSMEFTRSFHSIARQILATQSSGLMSQQDDGTEGGESTQTDQTNTDAQQKRKQEELYQMLQKDLQERNINFDPDLIAEQWAQSTVLSVVGPALLSQQERLRSLSRNQSKQGIKPNAVPVIKSTNSAQLYLKTVSASDSGERGNLNADIAAEEWIQSTITKAMSEVVGTSRKYLNRSAAFCGGEEMVLKCDLCEDPLSPFELEKNNTRKRFPCCVAKRHKHIHDFNICNACLLILTYPSTSGTRVGRCPLCTSWIRLRLYESTKPLEDNVLLHSDVDIQRITASGCCQSCVELKPVLVEKNIICDSCFLGKRQALWYVCQGCHGMQQIPYPMYRFQPSPVEFSTRTWMCEGRCQGPQRWRIRPNQVYLIPLRDAPWEDDWKGEAKLRVQMVRELIKMQQQRLGPGTAKNDCVIL